jgi:predicted DNA binding CopG/RHH family protein
VIAIYTLSDPRVNAVRYVGQTRDPKTRLCGHYTNPTGMKWISELKALGIRPSMNIIEWVDDIDARQRECFWIHEFNRAGCDLLNKHKYTSAFKSKKSALQSLKVSFNLHRRVKVQAFEDGLTLQEFVEQALEEELNQKIS